MKIYGITGPSGSGKTSLCTFLEKEGVAVIDCDKVVREIQVTGSSCLIELKDEFGPTIINADGSINRKALAQIAFSRPESTVKLNTITHKYVIEEVYNRLDCFSNMGCYSVAIEAAALWESNLDKICTSIIYLTSNPELLIQRIIVRDGLQRDEAELRLSVQMEQSRAIALSNIVLFNSGSKEDFQTIMEFIYQHCFKE